MILRADVVQVPPNLYYVKVRPRGAAQYPATEAVRSIQLDEQGNAGNLDGAVQFVLDWKWVEWMAYLNTVRNPLTRQMITDQPWRYLSVPNSGIFNRTELPDGTNDMEWYVNHREPVHNACLFDGNVINVINEFEDRLPYYEYQAINVSTDPVPWGWTFHDHWWVIHEVTSVTTDGQLRGVGSGLTDVYTPILSQGRVGIDRNLIERWTPEHRMLPGK